MIKLDKIGYIILRVGRNTMKKNIINELIIVCVSTLCIFTMVRVNEVEKNESLELSKGINALVMKSDGIDLGLVLNEATGNSAIDTVKETYVNSTNIEDIKDITVNNEIIYEPITCNEDEILNENELSNKIIEYNNANEENIVSFTVTKGSQTRYIKRKEQVNKQKAFTTLNTGYTDQNREVFLHNSITTPIRGVLTSTFGEQRSGYNHKGIDLAAEIGTKIQAALDGTVNFSGVAEGYGNVVIIDHPNNLQTVYAHCSKLKASTGEKVLRGQVIAEVGNTGDSTGPHLHFEIKVDGVPIDPLGYAGATEY